MSRSDLVDVDVQFQTQTSEAVCVRSDEDGEDIWVPKSRCEIEPANPSRGKSIVLTTDEAMAIEKELV